MKEPNDPDVPEFMFRLKPRGAPEGLRELVTATVAKEFSSSQLRPRWFTRTERRCFQMAGSLLLASIAFCYLIEKREQSRMTRLETKKEIPNHDRDLFPFLGCHDAPKLREWFLSYRDMAKPSVQRLLQSEYTLLQNTEIDPEFKSYVRGYYGFF
jgi:hypothetical protein